MNFNNNNNNPQVKKMGSTKTVGLLWSTHSKRGRRTGASSASLSALVALALLCFGCAHSDQPEQHSAVTVESVKLGQAELRHPLISPEGATIECAPHDSARGVLTIGTAQYKDVSITTTSPARIVLTTVQSDRSNITVPVFETSDLTQLYTDWMRAKHDLARSSRELERLRDLYAHNAIAGKEVTQAESDEVTSLTGLESRLLTTGLSAKELDHIHANVSLLIANVPESDISSVQLGEDVQILFDSFKGETFHGRVLDIGHAVDPATRTFNVRVELADKKHILRPGMFARSSFGVDVVHRFVVPQSAVVSVQGKSFVFVTKDGRTFERREVILGQQSNNDFIVTNGLSEGDQVVTGGAVLLKGLSFGS
jgi:cobalt-zinc-cadmium efflux system membrane fusion protein